MKNVRNLSTRIQIRCLFVPRSGKKHPGSATLDPPLHSAGSQGTGWSSGTVPGGLGSGLGNGKGICLKIETRRCEKLLALQLGVLWSKACERLSELKPGSASTARHNQASFSLHRTARRQYTKCTESPLSVLYYGLNPNDRYVQL
jgi:hypothetical protein